MEDKEDQEPNYTIEFRERRGSGRRAIVAARHVATRLESRRDDDRSDARFVVTGGDRQARIDVYGRFKVSTAEWILGQTDCNYTIKNVRKRV